jgi:hypothetical protein
MPVHLRLRMVGGQEGGDMPRLDLMEIPTPRATMMRPRVEIPYLMAIFLSFIEKLPVWGCKYPHYCVILQTVFLLLIIQVL